MTPNQYNTGKPCKRGHVSPRFISNGVCIQCDQERLRKEYKNPTERSRRLVSSTNWAKNHKEYVAQYLKNWVERNRHRVNSYFSSHRKGLVNRTPNWANVNEIDRIYQDCPQGYQVDHIYPLNGKLVSGLHVENNLQYLTEEQNRIKSNKFEVT